MSHQSQVCVGGGTRFSQTLKFVIFFLEASPNQNFTIIAEKFLNIMVKKLIFLTILFHIYFNDMVSNSRENDKKLLNKEAQAF